MTCSCVFHQSTLAVARDLQLTHLAWLTNRRCLMPQGLLAAYGNVGANEAADFDSSGSVGVDDVRRPPNPLPRLP
jgi:hypothetical protein